MNTPSILTLARRGAIAIPLLLAATQGHAQTQSWEYKSYIRDKTSGQYSKEKFLASTVTLDEPERCELRTPFVYIESRGERQLMLAGTCSHRLAKVDGAWRIRLKRVDLLDAGAALPAIQLFP